MKFDDNLPFVTISIPAYNHERYVTECLESAAAQTWPNLDLLVVDDGSPDGTLGRIEEFVEKNRARFRNVQVITRPNRGVAATMNETIEKANTEWVFSCASDDVMYPDRVRLQMESIRRWNEPELAIVYGAVDWIGPDGESIPPAVEEHYEPGVRRDLYLNFLATNPPHGACPAFRRAAVLAVGGYDVNLPVDDFYISLELAVRFPIGFIEDKVAAYRRHQSNLSSTYRSPRMIWGLLTATARFMEQHGDRVPDSLKRKVYRKNLLRSFRTARRARPSALPRLAWELATFKTSNKSPDDLYRYASLFADYG